MEGILERLSALEKNFTNEQFLTNKGLSNEVGIYIFAYEPKDEMAVQEFVRMQKNRNSAYNIVEFDLYKTFISICEEKKIIKSIPSMQERKGSEYLKEQLKKVASPEVFVKKMVYEPHRYGDIVVITGVGEIYPFLRVHSFLESIQHMFEDVPVVVMYPGKYDGQTLVLFNKFFDANHYRSFALVQEKHHDYQKHV